MSADPTDRARVFLCECGPILAKSIDLDVVAERVAQLPEVAGVERYATLCSDGGREWLVEQLRTHPGERPVIAGCSPSEHGGTFAEACRLAGRNPYLLGRANIREQCAWVTEDRDAATAKAVAHVRAAAMRCLRQQPLEEIITTCNADAVVIGAGLAGMTAALALAEAGRSVTLVERTPAIGGRIVLLGEVFPQMECASCMLEPLMDEVLHHPLIEVLTLSEVVDVLGYLGRFDVYVRRRARHVEVGACLGCGTCREVCPVETPDADYDAGMRARKAVGVPYAGALPNASMVWEAECARAHGSECRLCADACPFGAIDLDEHEDILVREAGAIVVATGMDLKVSTAPGSAFCSPHVLTTYEFERMLNADGPTGGDPIPPGMPAPARIALVHCADEDACAPAEECSGICCMQLAKFAREIAHRLPGTEVVDVFFERTAAGRGYRPFSSESTGATTAIRLGIGDTARVHAAEDGAIVTVVRDGVPTEIAVDLAVVAPPLAGDPSSAALGETLGTDVDGRGYFTPAHARLAPHVARRAGIALAGTAQGPKDAAQTVAHAAAAAGWVLAHLTPGGVLTHDPATAEVAEDACGGCRRCVAICPYKAIAFDEETRTARVNELLCHGCGTCAASCPSSAIQARHFTDGQIVAEIRALWAPGEHVQSASDER